jgi:hypothetical protein
MRRNKGLVLLAIVALAAFTVTATVAGGASASSGHAVAAKKKCKKKKAASAKKKKCKKKKGQSTAPVVRATLTWGPTADDPSADDADLDLLAFDSSGNKAGNGANSIPQSTLSPDITGKSGTETFTDLAPTQHRAFAFAVCYTVGGSVHTQFTIKYVTADGVTHTDTQRPGSSFHYEYPADGVSVPNNECNFA